MALCSFNDEPANHCYILLVLVEDIPNVKQGLMPRLGIRLGRPAGADAQAGHLYEQGQQGLMPRLGIGLGACASQKGLLPRPGMRLGRPAGADAQAGHWFVQASEG